MTDHKTTENDQWLPLWEDGPEAYLADYRYGSLPARSAAVRLKDKSFLVWSPGMGLRAGFEEAFGKGAANKLLASNSFHHLGLREWGEGAEGVDVVAAPGAVARLKRLGHPEIAGLETVKGLLPEGVEIVEAPFNRVGEAWLVLRAEKETCWVVCDAFFNIPKRPRKFLPRLIQTVMNNGPGLAVSRLWSYGAVKNRTAFRGWLEERIRADRPTILAPAHGAVATGADLPARLLEMATRL